MRKRISLAGMGLVALILFIQPVAVLASGQPGDAGLLFLRMGMGAREAAMGGAAVANATGASAAYWNPSRAAMGEYGTSAMLQQQSWLTTFDYTTASLMHNSSIGAIGLFYAGLNSDDLERTSAEGQAEGTFSPYNLAFGVSYSRAINERLALGAQGKVVYEKIDLYSGTVMLFDLFATWRVEQLPGLDLGFSYTNLGGQMTINQEPYDAPRTGTVGAAYAFQDGFMADRVVVAADVAFFNDGNEKAHVGAEYQVVPQFAVRGGYRVNYENQGLTMGFGLSLRNVNLGYAYEAMSGEALDPGHRFAVEFVF